MLSVPLRATEEDDMTGNVTLSARVCIGGVIMRAMKRQMQGFVLLVREQVHDGKSRELCYLCTCIYVAITVNSTLGSLAV